MQPQNHKGRTALLAILFVAACRLPGSAGTYLVDRTEDNATIAGTLRHEIYFNANINPGPDTIIFNVGTSIAVYSQIDVNGQLEIQGSGQTIGAYAKTYPIFNFGNGAAGSTITGIALVDADVGLLLGSNCNGTIVKGCRIGTDWEEVDDRGCNIGIDVRSHYNVIGGPAGDRNIIINNGQYGIRLLHTIIPRQNKIQGNYIGLQSDGMTAVPNDIGIFIQDSLSAWIGGDAASGEGNLISGNTQYGIYCDSADCIGNTIVGNLVGLNAAQSAQVPNQADGIRFNQNCAGNYVGLPGSSQYRNVLAGNTGRNLSLGSGCNRNWICNNFIGVNESGEAGFDSNIGIHLEGTQGVSIGGDRNTLERNVISGNNTGANRAGVYLLNANGNSICGNYIGTNNDGSAARPNYNGIVVAGSSSNNTIGGRNIAGITLGNVVSGNADIGINIVYGLQNYIEGNLVGLNAAGTNPLANGYFGMHLAGVQHRVGGTEAAQRNTIAGNAWQAINLNANNALVYGNYLGINGSGTAAVANGNNADIVCYANQCDIRNNYFTEQLVFLNNAMGNTVVGNKTGMLPNGSFSTHAPFTGVTLMDGAHGNYIGLRHPSPGNLIYNVTDRGIVVDGADTIHNALFGNTIVAAANGAIDCTNGGNGEKAAPVVTFAVSGIGVYGTAAAEDYIELFVAEKSTGNGGSLRFLGSGVTDVSGQWYVSAPELFPGEFVCALATDTSNTTSEFSSNSPVVQPTHTPTVTITPTVTPTRTSTVTVTVTPTSDNPLVVYDLRGRTTIAFPNPGKDQIRFLFHWDRSVQAKVNIYNISGERVAAWKHDFLPGTGQTLVWDCREVATGMYIAMVWVDGKEKQRIKLAVVH